MKHMMVFLLGFIIGIFVALIATLGLVFRLVEILVPILAPTKFLIRPFLAYIPGGNLLLIPVFMLMNGIIYGLLFVLIRQIKNKVS